MELDLIKLVGDPKNYMITGYSRNSISGALLEIKKQKCRKENIVYITIDCNDPIFAMSNKIVSEIMSMPLESTISSHNMKLLRLYRNLLREIIDHKEYSRAYFVNKINELWGMNPQYEEQLTSLIQYVLPYHQYDKIISIISSRKQDIIGIRRLERYDMVIELMSNVIMSLVLREIKQIFPELSDIIHSFDFYVDYNELLTCQNWADFQDKKVISNEYECIGIMSDIVPLINRHSDQNYELRLIFDRVEMIQNPLIQRELNNLLSQTYHAKEDDPLIPKELSNVLFGSYYGINIAYIVNDRPSTLQVTDDNSIVLDRHFHIITSVAPKDNIVYFKRKANAQIQKME